MKSWLKNKIQELYLGVDFDVLIPPDEKLGDYSVNLPFVLAKKESRKPGDVGQEVIEKLSDDKEFKNNFEKIELAGGGYINFYLSQEFLQKKLVEINSDKDYGQSQEGKGKKVIVEYSSPNIAKPMHIGHLRSTIIGDALANVYENLGYEVIRWNFLGDWGTQCGKLIAAYKKWGNDIPLHHVTIHDMVKWYIRFHEEIKNDPDLETEGQEEFRKLEEGDEENNEIWTQLLYKSLEEFEKNYKALELNSHEMVFRGESSYEKKVKPFIEELKDKGVTKESEGALIIELDNLPPAMLRKSDGATLYATRDLASLEDRIKNYKADKILYVVANQQALHFEQLFKVAQKLGWTDTELTHVKFGMVLGEDGKKLATREGKVVPLQEVIDKLNDLALKTVKEKNPDLKNEEAEKISKVVSIGALKYNDLKQHPYSDITFDWKAMLDLSGNSGPYIQYTYARLANIIKKASAIGEGDSATLSEPAARHLMKHLLDFGEAVRDCTKFYTLNGLALYLYDLAHLANKFYEEIRILEDDNLNRRDARLMLVKTTASVLKNGLNLLGIETLDRI